MAERFRFVVFLLGSVCVSAGEVHRIYIKDSTVPVQNSSVRIICDVTDYTNNVRIYGSTSPDAEKEFINTCTSSRCLSPNKGGASFTVVGNTININIGNVNRTRDQKYWWCEDKYLLLMIYTVPRDLQLDSQPSQDQDLVMNAVTLKCSTGCVYPKPAFKWFYTELGDSRQVWSSSGSVSQAGACSDSENRYTSTLNMARYTTFPDNKDKSVRFSCGITSFQGLTQELYSDLSVTVRFAVKATTPNITHQTTGVVLENDTVTLECTSSITRPAALVTWKKGSDSLTNVRNTVTNHARGLVSITSVVTFIPNRKDNNGMIICETSIPGQESKPNAQQPVTVYWPPFTPSIPTTNFPFLEGQTGKSIYCSSTEYGNPKSTALWTSEFGVPDSNDSRKLNLPTLSSDQNGMSAICQLKNHFTEQKVLQIKSPEIQIDVEYSPVVTLEESNTVIKSITRNEGQSISVFCNASGNPKPNVTWTGQTPGSAYLRMDVIDRSDHGTYTCKASAKSTHYPQHNFDTEKTLDVVVYYAPVVSVDLSNTDPEENSNLSISCKATGRPADYTYTSLFQTWGTVNISNTHLPVNGVIDIQNLQLEDSGTYKCLVNNGIPDRNNRLDQIGNVTVKIKVSPKLLLEDTVSVGAVGKSVNISAPFYSYPDIRDVEFRFPNGTPISNSSKYEVSFRTSKVSDKFYGQTVELEGYIAVLQIKDEVEADFINYTLILDNKFGSSKEWILRHISESVPSVPKLFSFTGFVKGIPTFLLLGGFNGGRLQTFLIETAIAGTDNWVEQLRFNETDRNFLQKEKIKFTFSITGLTPNTYDIRVLAGNEIGWIGEDDAPKTKFTIYKEDTKSESSPVGVIGGGIGAAVIAFIIASVVFIVVRRRSRKKDDSSTAINRREHVDGSDSSDDEVMTENLAYVSADEVSKKVKRPGADASNIYSQPHKTDRAALDTGDLYSSVTKTKAEDPRTLYAFPVKKDKMDKKKNKQKEKKDLKKGKTSKNKSEDVYENASELTPVKIKASEGSKYAYDENPYENPEESKPSRKKNVNKDGLIYADLTFNEQPKGQKKLVIHGLDSMTEYVEVDFTKKAEPLPDSDEETGNKN